MSLKIIPLTTQNLTIWKVPLLDIFLVFLKTQYFFLMETNMDFSPG